MSKINRQDTNGVKPLLATGELGYDNYPAGGDAGRIYVGTGTKNVALANKSEVAVVVGTIEDFPINPETGDTVIVKDINRGGTFIYDATESAVNNGGTVFDGWVRQYSGAVNVKWFGASPDATASVNSIAIQASVNASNNIFIPEGIYNINTTIQASSRGTTIIGEVSGRFGNTSAATSSGRSTLVNTTVGGGCIWQTPTKNLGGSGQNDGIIVKNLNLVADYPIKLNYEDGIVLDGASSDIPYFMRPVIENCVIQPRVPGTGVGIFMTKCFDFKIALNEIFGFNINIVMQGCDIGNVSNNRIVASGKYGMLTIGVGTFGSQTEIRNNDILGNATHSIVKTTDRHTRIYDNYFEASAPYIIDCTNVDITQYGTNVSTGNPTTIDISSNRIDINGTTSTYKINGNETGCKIYDLGNNGPTFSNLEIVNTYLSTMRTVAHKNNWDISIGELDGKYYSFKTNSDYKLTDNGFVFDSTNFSHSFNLLHNNSYMGLKLDGNKRIVWLASHTETPYLDFPSSLITSNSMCKITIKASGTSGDSFTVGKRSGAVNMRLGAISFKSTEIQEFSFVANSPTGLYLEKGVTSGDISIYSITVEKLRDRTIKYSGIASGTSGAETLIYSSPVFSNTLGIAREMYKVTVIGDAKQQFGYAHAYVEKIITVNNYSSVRQIRFNQDIVNSSSSKNVGVINLSLVVTPTINIDHLEITVIPTLTGSYGATTADFTYKIERLATTDYVQ